MLEPSVLKAYPKYENCSEISSLQKLYYSIQSDIIKRIDEFTNIQKHGSKKDIFAELVFCLLTPQTKARVCWYATKRLLSSELLFKATGSQIGSVLRSCGVRFHNNKTRYIIKTREMFWEGSDTLFGVLSLSESEQKKRKWLIENVKGFGYKEASHFLRNIGVADNLAILDRHILKSLLKYEVIKDLPRTISPKKYEIMEKKMQEFAKSIQIPLNHLDLLFWYQATGEIFK
jgi:N-glycosylase/DNA lyase